MADIEQSLQDIQQERSRLLTAKENLKTAITGKGVAVPDSAKLDEYSSFVNGIQQGNNVDLSFVTAGAGDILSGKTGTDKDGNPVNGTIATVTPTLTDNVFTVDKGYIPEKETLTVETVTPSLSGNKFTVKKGYVASDTELTVPVVTATLSKNVTTVPVWYIAKQQTLTVPEAPSPTVDGNTVTIHPGYVPAEQTIETEGGGGSMEIYKCVDADGMTWWVVSGCGSTEANGRYYQDEIWSDYRMDNVKIYYQKDGSCSLVYDDYDGRWVLKSGSTVLYRDEGWNYYDGDPSQCTSWVTDSGVEPVPSITKETTTGNGWKGKKYDTETGEVADTVTDLTYKYNPPQIGKFYTADGVIECDVLKQTGLVFYAPLHEQKAMDEFGRVLNIPNGVEFTTLNNVKMAKFDSECITFDCAGFPTDGSRTMSCFVKCNSVTYGHEVAAFGYGDDSQSRVCLVGAVRESSGRFYFGSTYGADIISEIAGTLSHLALSYSKETKVLAFYIDGVLIGTVENLSINTALQDGKIGSAPWNYSGWGGYVSECKLWNRALSADEIKAEADRCLAMVTE